MLGAGFNHFWHAESENHGGDCLYIQGHSAPKFTLRTFLEGRITEEQLLNFRQEVDGKACRYPHPKLMPDFWQFPTVSMGLGPLMAIYQARFLKYLHAASPTPRTARCGPSSATARWTRSNRWAPSAWRRARSWTTWCSSSTATCSAWTGRCAATARSSRNWKGNSAAPAGRGQAGLGQLLGSAAGARQGRHPAQGHDGTDDGDYQAMKAATAPSCARTSSAAIGCWRWSRR